MLQTEGTFVKPNEAIKVTVEFQPKKPRIYKLSFVWQTKRYEIRRIHLYHTAMHGEVLMHYLSVTANRKFFKLRFDSKRLQWFIDEVFEP